MIYIRIKRLKRGVLGIKYNMLKTQLYIGTKSENVIVVVLSIPVSIPDDFCVTAEQGRRLSHSFEKCTVPNGPSDV